MVIDCRQSRVGCLWPVVSEGWVCRLGAAGLLPLAGLKWKRRAQWGSFHLAARSTAAGVMLWMFGSIGPTELVQERTEPKWSRQAFQAHGRTGHGLQTRRF